MERRTLTAAEVYQILLEELRDRQADPMAYGVKQAYRAKVQGTDARYKRKEKAATHLGRILARG